MGLSNTTQNHDRGSSHSDDQFFDLRLYNNGKKRALEMFTRSSRHLLTCCWQYSTDERFPKLFLALKYLANGLVWGHGGVQLFHEICRAHRVDRVRSRWHMFVWILVHAAIFSAYQWGASPWNNHVGHNRLIWVMCSIEVGYMVLGVAIVRCDRDHT